MSGVCCHISCALQLLANGASPLTSLLCNELLPILNDDETLLMELGQVLAALRVSGSDSMSSPVDPSKLYKVLEKRAKLDPHNVGDVSTAIYLLLRTLKDISPEWKTAVDFLFGSGETQLRIQGVKGQIRRVKRGKVKAMACPFPLPLERYSDESILSLGEIVGDLVEPSSSYGTEMQDYDWGGQPMESYEEETLPEFSGSDTWKTTRSIHIVQAPRLFFVSLNRFAYTPDGDRILKYPILDTPLEIQIGDHDYRLKGGVLHVSEESIVEEGHYVTVIASTEAEEMNWSLIDDEQVTMIDNEEAMNFLRGTQVDDGVHYCAVLVVYERCNGTENDIGWEILTKELKKRYQNVHVNWSEPYSLLGRKLKVKWAKGKFYGGVVDSYDEVTGKHRILYDDGDVKGYELKKKTVKWI